MAYPKEVRDIFKRVPKEHHEDLKSLIKIYYELGVKDTQELVSQITEVPPQLMRDYGVHHYEELDGG